LTILLHTARLRRQLGALGQSRRVSRHTREPWAVAALAADDRDDLRPARRRITESSCLDPIRAERDPAWPLILAQLSAQASADPPACDTVLATMVAAQAAAQALAFIDQGAQAAAVTNGTLELVLPAWQWRRRTWQPHRDCACGARCSL
jgi:hypothetical protein